MQLQLLMGNCLCGPLWDSVPAPSNLAEIRYFSVLRENTASTILAPAGRLRYKVKHLLRPHQPPC